MDKLSRGPTKGMTDAEMDAAGGHGTPSMVRRPKSETASDAELGLDAGPITSPIPKTVGERLGQGAAAVNSTADRMFLGAPSAVLRAVGDPGGIAQGIDQYRQENPNLAPWTDAPAYLEGPVNAGARAVERVIPQVTNRIAQVARTGIATGITSGGAAGAESVLRGDSPEDTARNALVAAGTGHLVGTGLGSVAGALGRTGEAVRNSAGAKARATIEAHGGEVGPTTSGRGPVFDTMATKGTTDADIGAQAEVSAKAGLDMLNRHKRTAMGAAGQKIGAVNNSPAAATPRDVSDIVTRMRDAIHDLDTAPQTRSALQDTIAQIEAHQKQGFDAAVDPYVLSDADVNKLRRSLDRHARTGVSTDEKLNPLKQAANLTREMVGQGPYAEPNAEYAASAKDAQASRRMLGINERPKTPEESQAAVSKVKNLITRRGQNTVTAGGQTDQLAAFEAKHPDIGEEFARPSLLRAKADLGIHVLPQLHGGLIERLKGLGPLGSAAALAVPSMTLAHSPGAAATAAGLGLLLQNRNAINGRLLYPLIRFAPEAQSQIQRLAPVLEEGRQQEQR